MKEIDMVSILEGERQMAKEKAVDTVLTGAETAEAALKILQKKYDSSTVVQMLNRGEYDVLYRKSRQEVTSEQRKSQKLRLDALEKLYIKNGGSLADLEKQIKG